MLAQQSVQPVLPKNDSDIPETETESHTSLPLLPAPSKRKHRRRPPFPPVSVDAAHSLPPPCPSSRTVALCRLYHGCQTIELTTEKLAQPDINSDTLDNGATSSNPATVSASAPIIHAGQQEEQLHDQKLSRRMLEFLKYEMPVRRVLAYRKYETAAQLHDQHFSVASDVPHPSLPPALAEQASQLGLALTSAVPTIEEEPQLDDHQLSVASDVLPPPSSSTVAVPLVEQEQLIVPQQLSVASQAAPSSSSQISL